MNPELIIWDYGKEITVTLEDALYSPASQGMTWGGKLGTKHLTLYGEVTAQEHSITANTDEAVTVPCRIEISNFKTFTQIKSGDTITDYRWLVDCNVVSKNGAIRLYLKDYLLTYNIEDKTYSLINNTSTGVFFNTNTDSYFEYSIQLDTSSNKYVIPPEEIIYQVDHALNNVYYLDRIEKCRANQRFCIDTDINLQHANYRYLEEYAQCELTVFIDPRTMQPYESNTQSFVRKDGTPKTGNLREIKQYEIYYKWTRSKIEDYGTNPGTTLGHQIIVDAIHFPGTYRLVGETYARSRKTGKDQRYQFEIPLCKMGTENNLTLEAEGDPTTFNMTLKVMRREDGVMMKLTQYNVANAKFNDVISDSTNVVPIAEVAPEYPYPTGTD